MFDADQFNKLFSEGNSDDIPNINEAAGELYKVYNAFVQAGFSEAQAMQIILGMLFKIRE